MIKHLHHTEIDKEKWDSCIKKASNSLIYVYSWYLDIVSPNWNALVEDDYESVMPLPVRKKLFINYVYQPYFAQQLGIYSRKESYDEAAFISALPKTYKLVECNLNERNQISDNILRNNSNYILDMSRPYEIITQGYTRNCKRNLKKAYQAGFQIDEGLGVKEFINFVRSNLESQIEGIGSKEFIVLEKLVSISLQKEKAKLVGLYDSKNQLHAAGYFLINIDRFTFSVCASTEYGKQNQAMYYLVDSQIKKYAGNYKWFDFSGSNIKGIAYFNSTFGAEPTNYKTLSINRLPKVISIFKK